MVMQADAVEMCLPALDAQVNALFWKELGQMIGRRLDSTSAHDACYRTRWLELQKQLAARHPELTGSALNTEVDRLFWREVHAKVGMRLSDDKPAEQHYRRRWLELRASLIRGDEGNRAEQQSELGEAGRAAQAMVRQIGAGMSQVLGRMGRALEQPPDRQADPLPGEIGKMTGILGRQIGVELPRLLARMGRLLGTSPTMPDKDGDDLADAARTMGKRISIELPRMLHRIGRLLGSPESLPRGSDLLPPDIAGLGRQIGGGISQVLGSMGRLLGYGPGRERESAGMDIAGVSRQIGSGLSHMLGNMGRLLGYRRGVARAPAMAAPGKLIGSVGTEISRLLGKMGKLLGNLSVEADVPDRSPGDATGLALGRLIGSELPSLLGRMGRLLAESPDSVAKPGLSTNDDIGGALRALGKQLGSGVPRLLDRMGRLLGTPLAAAGEGDMPLKSVVRMGRQVGAEVFRMLGSIGHLLRDSPHAWKERTPFMDGLLNVGRQVVRQVGTMLPTVLGKQQFLGEKIRSILDWVKEKARALLPWIINPAGSAGKWMGEKLRATRDWVKEKASTLLPWIINPAGSAGKWMGEKLRTTRDWVKEKANTLLPWLINPAGSAGKWMGEKVRENRDWVKEKATGALPWIINPAGSAGKWMGEKVRENRDWVKEKATGALPWIINPAASAGKWMGKKVRENKDWVKEKATGALPWIINPAASAGKWMGEKVGGAKDWAKTKVASTQKSKAGSTASWAKEKAGAVTDWAKKKVESVSKPISAAGQWAGEKAQSAGEWASKKAESAWQWVTGGSGSGSSWSLGFLSALPGTAGGAASLRLAPLGPSAMQHSRYGDRSEVDPALLRERVLAAEGAGFAPGASVMQPMERMFGADFGGVRFHAGPATAQTARNLNAEAFTIGHDVFFGEGKYDPDTRRGLGLIAHEMTHVSQQSGAGSPARFFSREGGDAMEAEAQQTRQMVLADAATSTPFTVDEYIRVYEDDDGSVSEDSRQRLDVISLKALEIVEHRLKTGAMANIESLEVSLELNLERMSNDEAAQVWAHNIIEIIRRQIRPGVHLQAGGGSEGVQAKAVQYWGHSGHVNLTKDAAAQYGFTEAETKVAVAHSNDPDYYMHKRTSVINILPNYLPKFLGLATRGEGVNHGEGLNYTNPDLSANAVVNQAAVSAKIAEAIMATDFNNPKLPHMKILGWALHMAQDRGSHWEGTKGMGHDDPRCNDGSGYNTDSPKDNVPGYSNALSYSLDVIKAWKDGNWKKVMATASAPTPDQSLLGGEDDNEALKFIKLKKGAGQLASIPIGTKIKMIRNLIKGNCRDEEEDAINDLLDASTGDLEKIVSTLGNGSIPAGIEFLDSGIDGQQWKTCKQIIARNGKIYTILYKEAPPIGTTASPGEVDKRLDANLVAAAKYVIAQLDDTFYSTMDERIIIRVLESWRRREHPLSEKSRQGYTALDRIFEILQSCQTIVGLMPKETVTYYDLLFKRSHDKATLKKLCETQTKGFGSKQAVEK
jgi:hypothetical protein